jgi:arylsulfatase A-like enzyme
MMARNPGRTSRIHVGTLLVLALLCLCLPGACGRGGRAGARPSLVLVVLDTVRRDATGLAGPEGDTSTPHLDALAGRGTRFVNAWSVAPWTLPSHASLFTGLLPSEHGSTSRTPRLAPGLSTLAERLSACGYETAAFYSNPWLSDAATGLLRGFETRVEAPVGSVSRMRSESGDQGGAETLANVRHWLEQRGSERPFFLFVNLLEAHLPYDPPADVRERWLADLPPDIQRTIPWSHAVNAGARVPDADEWETTRRLYRADVRWADRLLGRLVDLLTERGQIEDSVLVVTSDHGENLGRHGLAEHQFSVHETLLAVPLVIVAPASICPPGTRDEPVLLTDLHATLAGIAGAEVDTRPHSRSLLDPRRERARTRPLLAEYAPPAPGLVRALVRRNPELDLTRLRRGYRTLRVGNHRLTLASDGRVELNDLAADPLQQHDSAASDPAKVEELLASLEALDALSRAGDPDEDGTTDELDEETAERLRALGYYR